jgi:segregation and condensation protein B
MEKENLEELKKKLEAILFCIPEGVSVQNLAHRVNLGFTSTVKNALEALQKDYENRGSSLNLLNEGDTWRLKVKDEFVPVVTEAAEPEFDRAVLETLAYIAWRGGSRQCDVVRVRGNKAYDHIKLLREKGLVEAHRSGLSKWLELTKKFYEYFNMKQGEKLPAPEVKPEEQPAQVPAESIQETPQVQEQAPLNNPDNE